MYLSERLKMSLTILFGVDTNFSCFGKIIKSISLVINLREGFPELLMTIVALTFRLA